LIAGTGHELYWTHSLKPGEVERPQTG